ncbi:sister chromatid cohesion protein DCC1 [Salvia hispanica]|uniref:sister chromatid cohesion protein DCC1 n=1 Tax=Salvia hispanica TaxID=49212 RepID=UPI0020096EC1|nr:sister chromatid cohesion protein DCC1 [Salvia hispanica]XP_047951179.1 sister chromatid cohesion protein DCC1 [Salvia hispanica]XP_047951180.1 sister chromatid cohesion protein DCC1 [Salvia hispanica]
MDNLHQQTACSAGAEAILSLQPSSSISLTYHSLFGPHNDLMLLELDDKLLPDILHQRVTLRGQPDEDAVLCTSSKTYAVKFVGTSNSMLLIPPSEDVSRSRNNKDDGSLAVASVLKVAPGCMELVEVAPKLDELKLLLSQKPYSFGEASEMDISEEREETGLGLYRWEDLVERIQASDEELKMGLQSISAVEIDGYWRILDDSYMHAILSMLLHNVILSNWSINALDEDEVLGMLEADGFPRNIAKHCLQAYGNKVDDEGACVSHLWILDERRVCVCLAREILKGGKMKLEIFMEKWMRKLPDGMCASFEMLEGEILTEKLGIETWLYPFSVSSLPSTPAERFAILFQQRLKWEWKDLQPYVRDLKVPGLTSEALLLKYTRRSQPTAEAEPVFSAR